MEGAAEEGVAAVLHPRGESRHRPARQGRQRPLSEIEPPPRSHQEKSLHFSFVGGVLGTRAADGERSRELTTPPFACSVAPFSRRKPAYVPPHLRNRGGSDDRRGGGFDRGMGRDDRRGGYDDRRGGYDDRRGTFQGPSPHRDGWCVGFFPPNDPV